MSHLSIKIYRDRRWHSWTIDTHDAQIFHVGGKRLMEFCGAARTEQIQLSMRLPCEAEIVLLFFQFLTASCCFQECCCSDITYAAAAGVVILWPWAAHNSRHDRVALDYECISPLWILHYLGPKDGVLVHDLSACLRNLGWFHLPPQRDWKDRQPCPESHGLRPVLLWRSHGPSKCSILHCLSWRHGAPMSSKPTFFLIKKTTLTQRRVRIIKIGWNFQTF